MIVQANLYPVARGLASKGNEEEGKLPKKKVVFVSSYFGKRDNDGLYMEALALDAWLPVKSADLLKFGAAVSGVIDVNGDFITVKEINILGERYVISEKGIAELMPDANPKDKK